MYSLTTIAKLNQQAEEAALILASHGAEKGTPKFDEIVAQYKAEQAEIISANIKAQIAAEQKVA